MTLQEKLITTLSQFTYGDIVVAIPKKFDLDEAKIFLSLVRNDVDVSPQILHGADFTFVYGSKQKISEDSTYQTEFLKKCNDETEHEINFFITN